MTSHRATITATFTTTHTPEEATRQLHDVLDASEARAALHEVAKQCGLPFGAFQAGCEETLADTILQHALFGRRVAL